MVCLGTLCFVLPERVSIGDKTLRWPTIAEVLGNNGPITDSLPAIYEPILDNTPTLLVDSTIPEASKVELPKVVIPKVAVDSVTDSRMFLQAFYDALAESSD